MTISSKDNKSMSENNNQFVPLVSVVIPAYNAESYLNRCLDSVLNQSFQNFEIIVVNDGSVDMTARILDEYSEIDKRVIPIHQENKGVSAARNVGIEKARGKWLVFVDSDDWIKENMLQDLYSVATKYDADLVMGKMYHCNGDSGNIREHELKAPLIECAQNPLGVDASEKAIIGYALRRGVAYSNLAKIYRKSVVLENNIMFDSNFSYCEDVMFNCNYMRSANKIIISDSHYYYAESVADSLTKRYSESIVESTILSHRMLLELFKDKNIEDKKWYELLDVQLLNSLWDVVFCLLSGKYSNISKKQSIKSAEKVLMQSEFIKFMEKYQVRRDVCSDSQTAKFANKVYRVGHEKICIWMIYNYILCRDFVRKVIGGK